MVSSSFFDFIRGYLGAAAIVRTNFPENSPRGLCEHYHIKAMLPHHTGAADVCWAAMGALTGLLPVPHPIAAAKRRRLLTPV
jgi:hypothetical protein